MAMLVHRSVTRAFPGDETDVWLCGLELQTTVDGLEILLTSFLVGIPFFTRFFFENVRW